METTARDRARELQGEYFDALCCLGENEFISDLSDLLDALHDACEDRRERVKLHAARMTLLNTESEPEFNPLTDTIEGDWNGPHGPLPGQD